MKLAPKAANVGFKAAGQAFKDQRAGERGGAAPSPNAISGLTPSEMAYIKSLGSPLTPANLSAMRQSLGIPDTDVPASTSFAPSQSGGGLDVGSTASPSAPGSSGGFGVNQVGGALGALGGGYGLYQGIKNKNALQATAGGLGAASGIANLAGATGVGGALGAVGGPLGLYQGIKNEDPVGIATGAINTALGASNISGMLGGPTISSLAGGGAAGGAAAGAGFGAGGAGAAAGGAGAAGVIEGAGTGIAAGASTAGAGLTGVATGGVGVVFAAIIMLEQMGYFDKWGKSGGKTAADLSRDLGRMGIENADQLVGGQKNLLDMARYINTEFAPNKEVQFGSAPRFGAQGSPEWLDISGRLADPSQANPADIEEFVRNLSVKYGETGAANISDDELAYKTRANIVNALPNIPEYQALKAAYQTGGEAFNAEQTRMQGIMDWYSALPNSSEEGGTYQPEYRNTYDPYTDTITHPDGRTSKLAHTTIANYSLNPFAYDPMRSAGMPRDASVNEPYQPIREDLYQSQFGPRQQLTQQNPIFYPTTTMSDWMPTPAVAPAAAPAPVTGAMDPGVQVGGAGKRSPQFATPELDNRAEAAQGAGSQGKLPGQVGSPDQGVPFGMAGKRPGGGMGVAPQPRPGGGRPGGQAPFGGVPRGGMMPQMSGGRPQPSQQRRNGGVV